MNMFGLQFQGFVYDAIVWKEHLNGSSLVCRMYFRVKPGSNLVWSLIEQSLDETVHRVLDPGEDPSSAVDLWGKSRVRKHGKGLQTSSEECLIQNLGGKGSHNAISWAGFSRQIAVVHMHNMLIAHVLRSSFCGLKTNLGAK